VSVQGGTQIATNLLGNVVIDGFQQSVHLLQSVLKSLSNGNIGSACNQLDAFVKQMSAQIGKSLTTSEAGNLTGMATTARAALGCR
jgi:hypothetical protein